MTTSNLDRIDTQDLSIIEKTVLPLKMVGPSFCSSGTHRNDDFVLSF